MSDINDSDPTNIDIFNLAVAVIFARLYKEFPIVSMILPEYVAVAVLGEERYWEPHSSRGITHAEDAVERTSDGFRYYSIAAATITWLTQSGFMSQVENRQSPDNK